jgi:hypothetical protein
MYDFFSGWQGDVRTLCVVWCQDGVCVCVCVCVTSDVQLCGLGSAHITRVTGLPWPQIARAGDIVAIGGLKDVITGETLCDEKNPIILERMDFPDPVIKIAIEPKSKVGWREMWLGHTLRVQMRAELMGTHVAAVVCS